MQYKRTLAAVTARVGVSKYLGILIAIAFDHTRTGILQCNFIIIVLYIQYIYVNSKPRTAFSDQHNHTFQYKNQQLLANSILLVRYT